VPATQQSVHSVALAPPLLDQMSDDRCVPASPIPPVRLASTYPRRLDLLDGRVNPFRHTSFGTGGDDQLSPIAMASVTSATSRPALGRPGGPMTLLASGRGGRRCQLHHLHFGRPHVAQIISAIRTAGKQPDALSSDYHIGANSMRRTGPSCFISPGHERSEDAFGLENLLNGQPGFMLIMAD
jgi:hypothetical protein